VTRGHAKAVVSDQRIVSLTSGVSTEEHLRFCSLGKKKEKKTKEMLLWHDEHD
jgi:hypothetical protein